MRTIAFVGPSGTGKSHRAAQVAKQNGADAIIDDGLLISGNRVVAGTSAKKAPTKLASVRQALFVDQLAAKEVSLAIKKLNPKCVMILGTSDGMVNKIASALGLPDIDKIVRIESVASKEQMEQALNMRKNEGKHVIPAPAFEIKKDFSGYFLHPMRFFRKSLAAGDDFEEDKTIVRPTFSYLGEYTISDNVVISSVKHEAMREKAVYRVNSVNIRSTAHGAHIDVTLTLKYGVNIPDACHRIQHRIRDGVERYTSINVRRVHIYVRGLYYPQDK